MLEEPFYEEVQGMRFSDTQDGQGGGRLAAMVRLVIQDMGQRACMDTLVGQAFPRSKAVEELRIVLPISAY